MCGFQDFAGAAEAYGALLQHSMATAPADSGAALPAAERMSALAKRAAALLRLGRYQAARADCDAALALLLHEQAHGEDGPGSSGAARPEAADMAGGAALALLLHEQAHGGAGPGGGSCNSAAKTEAADAAGGAPAASCPSADPGPGGLSSSAPTDSSSCTEPVTIMNARDSMSSPCSAHDALLFAHALAARLQKEAIPAEGLAGEGSTSAEACAEAACVADASGQQGRGHAAGHAGDDSGGWGPGGGKLAMLLRLLVRRGSAFAHDKRCEHRVSACMLLDVHSTVEARCTSCATVSSYKGACPKVALGWHIAHDGPKPAWLVGGTRTLHAMQVRGGVLGLCCMRGAILCMRRRRQGCCAGSRHSPAAGSGSRG